MRRWPAGQQADTRIVPALRDLVARLEAVILTAQVARDVAQKSSDSARKIFVRKVCSSVRQDSPGAWTSAS